MPFTVVGDGFQSLSNRFEECVCGDEPGDPICGDSGEQVDHVTTQ
jgi:hypothetical protein